MSADLQAVKQGLEKLGFESVSHLQTFEAVRTTPGGGSQMVTIRVYDEGPGADKRYSAEAEADGGKKTVRSNARDTLEDALRNVHWNELD